MKSEIHFAPIDWLCILQKEKGSNTEEKKTSHHDK